MTMTAYTFLTPSGLLIGDGTPYIVEQLQGLDGAVVVNHDIPAFSGGSVPGRDVPGPRTLIFTISLANPAGGASLETPLEAFATAWKSTNTDGHLAYRLDGQTLDRYVIGRPRQWTTMLDIPASMGSRKLVASFFCPKSTIYDSTNTAVDF